jgi:membrane protease YdiL (CAAX protease family)
VATLGSVIVSVLQEIPIFAAFRGTSPPEGVSLGMWRQAIAEWPMVFALSAILGCLASLSIVRLALGARAGIRPRLGLVSPGLHVRQWVSLVLAFLGLRAMTAGIHQTLSALHWLPISLFQQVPNAREVSFAVLALMILGGILPAVGEEVLFRGYVQRGLVSRWGARAGILVTSIGCAAAHGWPRGLWVLPASIYLGWVVWKSGSIWTSILAQITASFALILVIQIAGGSWTWMAKASYGSVISMIAVGGAVFTVGVRHLQRSFPADGDTLGRPV